MTDNSLVLRYISHKIHNVHRNRKCSVFHEKIYLFNERNDFCDFDIGYSNLSTNFVKHRTRVYWEETKHPCFNTRGWVTQFPSLLKGWVSHFCADGKGWAMCFLSTTFPNAPAPAPLPLYFFTSPSKLKQGIRPVSSGEHVSCRAGKFCKA